jgi:hypothetical protein
MGRIVLGVDKDSSTIQTGVNMGKVKDNLEEINSKREELGKESNFKP